MPSSTGATALASKALGASTASTELAATFGPNLRHTLLLVGGFFVLLAGPLVLLWGVLGIAATAGLVIGLSILALRMPSDSIVRLYQATHIAPDDSQLSSLVDVLAYRAELPQRPDFYVIPSATLSAFSTGAGGRSAIAVTEGLLRRLSLSETAAVLSHEMAHIRHRDTAVFGLADVITRAAQVMSYAGLGVAAFNVYALATSEDTVSWWAVLGLYLAPTLSNLLQNGLSRDREFKADVEAVTLTGDREALGSALKHIKTDTGHVWEDLMLPVPGRHVPYPSLMRSHPDADERIRRLASAEIAQGHDPLVIVEQPMVSLVGYGPGDMRPRHRWPGLWF
jgi:heat shock protein HtpX